MQLNPITNYHSSSRAAQQQKSKESRENFSIEITMKFVVYLALFSVLVALCSSAAVPDDGKKCKDEPCPCPARLYTPQDYICGSDGKLYHPCDFSCTARCNADLKKGEGCPTEPPPKPVEIIPQSAFL